MTQSPQVVIVGAGPAGSMAALALGERGVGAVLLDRHRFPRDKPCGGGIRSAVVSRFPDVIDHARRRAALHPIRRVVLASPGGRVVVVEREVPLYFTFRRLDFDAALLDGARAAGVRVIEGARVTDVDVAPTGARLRCADGRVFAGEIVIGADGVNGVVARQTGLHRRWPDHALAIDMMEETEADELSACDEDAIYVAYALDGCPGYGYVFPKAGHVDAGVGFLLSHFKAQRDGSPYQRHLAFLETARARGVVRGRSNPENFSAYRLPLGGPLARTHADRVLLAGDAGGFVNAYTGEGIYHAMVTGHHAGLAAAAALASGDVSARGLSGYARAWEREIGPELRESIRIQRRLFANPRLADGIIGAAAADRGLARLFAAVALGERPLGWRKLEVAARMARHALRLRMRLSRPREVARPVR